MIAKPIGFTATATPTLDYLHHDKGGVLTAERVEWAENVNCIQASAQETERMWAQLVDDAPELKRQAGGSSRGRRLEKPYGQYVFSWHPDENPSREHILATVKDGMKKLGYGQCQYRVVVHCDTDHVHAHVIVCRVHPENGRAMGRKNDGERMREWSLDYEKAQGRIRVPGRLDDLTNRRRHSRQKRTGQQPTPATPEAKKRHRERRRRRRTTRDAIGRPVVLNERERREWGTLLRADPTRGQKAALKRRQTAGRIEAQRQRAARLEAAAGDGGSVPAGGLRLDTGGGRGRLEAEIAKGEAALEKKRARLKKKRAERRSTERGLERKLRNRQCIIVGAVVLGRLVDVEPADALRRRSRRHAAGGAHSARPPGDGCGPAGAGAYAGRDVGRRFGDVVVCEGAGRVTEPERRDYARGYVALADGGEVPAAVFKEAAELAFVVERSLLFGPGQVRRDKWRWDEDRQMWTVPPRDGEPEELAPMREGAVEPEPRSSGGTGSGRSSGSGGADLSTLSDAELFTELEKAEAWERWQRDPVQRRRRWDRRAIFVGAVLRGRRRES